MTNMAISRKERKDPLAPPIAIGVTQRSQSRTSSPIASSTPIIIGISGGSTQSYAKGLCHKKIDGFDPCTCQHSQFRRSTAFLAPKVQDGNQASEKRNILYQKSLFLLSKQATYRKAANNVLYLQNAKTAKYTLAEWLPILR